MARRELAPNRMKLNEDYRINPLPTCPLRRRLRWQWREPVPKNTRNGTNGLHARLSHAVGVKLGAHYATSTKFFRRPCVKPS